jgi:ligand-binding sensor domain-containing protein
MSEIITPVREPTADAEAVHPAGGPPRYFALFEAAPGVLLAGTCGRGMTRSVDGGATWSPVEGPFGDGNVNAVVAGHDGELLAACGTSGVLVSHDLGKAWTLLADGFDEVYCVAAVGRELLAGTASGVAARRDVDRWAFEDGGPTGTVYRLLPLDGGALAAATENEGVWIRLPGGAWRPIGLREAPVFDLVTLDSGDMLAGTRGRGVSRWVRDADEWRTADSQPSDPVVHAVERLPDGSLVAGTGQGVATAGADGEGWAPLGNEIAHHRMFSVLVTRDGAVLTGSYDGVWRWRPGEADWTRLDTGLDVGAVFGVAVIDDVAYVGGSAGAFRSDDHGESWQQIRPGDLRGNVYSFCRSGGRLMVASDDGVWDAGTGRPGEPWQRAGLEGKRVYTLIERAPGHLLVGTLGEGVWSRPAEDQEWHRSSDGLGDNLAFDLRLSASTGDVLLATGRVSDGFKSGGIHRSSDGESWRSVALDPNTVYDVIESSSGIVLGGAQRTRILRSQDGGESFVTTRPHGRQEAKMYSLSNDQRDRLYLGTGSELLRSDDDGESWEVVGRGLDGVTIYGIAGDSNDTLIAATSSGVYRSVDAGVNWSPVNWNP